MTIINRDAFLSGLPAQYDGEFDWDWTKGCFGETKIAPMDVDGMVERGGNFLLFETKDMGKFVPEGQLRTLRALYRLGCFTVVFVYGKKKPAALSVWHAPDFRSGVVMDPAKPVNVSIAQARALVTSWFMYADKNAKNPQGRWVGVIPDSVDKDPIQLPGDQ
jgi:hypothetical protein